jgi:hypothetical protein
MNRYRVLPADSGGEVLERQDDGSARVVARCLTPGDATMVAAALNDHQGAVGALEEILDGLRRPDAPRSDFSPAVAHVIKVAEGALARLRGEQ